MRLRPFSLSIAAAPDVFVTKLNATGSAILFSTYLGGNSVDYHRGGRGGYRF